MPPRPPARFKVKAVCRYPSGSCAARILGIQSFSVARNFSCAFDDLGIALRIDHQRDAHGFHGLVYPGIREYVALMKACLFAAQFLAGFHEVVDAARTQRHVVAIDDVNAMRDPVGHQRLGAGIPELTVDLEILGVDRFELLRGRWRLHGDVQRGCTLGLAVVGSQLDDISAGRGEGGGGDQRARVRELHFTGAGFFAPHGHRSRPGGRGRRRRRLRGLRPTRTFGTRRIAISHPAAQVRFAGDDGNAIHPGNRV